MTGARSVSANSSAVTDRRYSHPERSRGIPLRKLASSHRHPPEASEGPHLFGGDHTKYIGIFATLSEVPQSERDWRCLRGSG
jgi:hypothetical protein